MKIRIAGLLVAVDEKVRYAAFFFRERVVPFLVELKKYYRYIKKNECAVSVDLTGMMNS